MKLRSKSLAGVRNLLAHIHRVPLEEMVGHPYGDGAASLTGDDLFLESRQRIAPVTVYRPQFLGHQIGAYRVTATV